MDDKQDIVRAQLRFGFFGNDINICFLTRRRDGREVRALHPFLGNRRERQRKVTRIWRWNSRCQRCRLAPDAVRDGIAPLNFQSISGENGSIPKVLVISFVHGAHGYPGVSPLRGNIMRQG
ncbi:MAG: hypothetical protein AB7E05_11690 [Sphingobium sp.]